MTNSGNCRNICWALAAVAGLLVLWMVSGEVSFFAALMLGAALAVLLGLMLTRFFCSEAEVDTSVASAAPGPVAEKPAAAKPEPVKPAAPAAAKTTAPKAAKPAKSAVKKAPAKAKAKPKATAAGTADYDGDGKNEGTGEGTRPEALSGPRDGKADDLKQIKGVGPKLEVMLNEMGFYHFDQIAGWSADEIAWVNANLKGFKGRVTRDNWIEQATVLAKGGATEFSKRVEDGGVY